MEKRGLYSRLIPTSFLVQGVCLVLVLFLCVGVTTADSTKEQPNEVPDAELALSFCKRNPKFGNDGWDEFCGKCVPPDFMDSEFGPHLDLEGSWVEEYRMDGRVVAARRVGLYKSQKAYNSLVAIPSRQDRLGRWFYCVRDGWDIDETGNQVPLSSVEWNHKACSMDSNGKLSVFEYRKTVMNKTDPNSMAGTWTIDDNWNSRHEKGTVVSQKVYPRIDRVRFLGDKVDEIRFGKRTGILEIKYQGPTYGRMRGNRRNIYIEVYGENLWGYHRTWIDRVHNLEPYGTGYILRKANSSGFGDQIVGIRFKFVTWPDMFPGKKVLWIDDIPIPFELVLNNYPKERLPAAEQINAYLQQRAEPESIEMRYVRRREDRYEILETLPFYEPIYVELAFKKEPEQLRREVVVEVQGATLTLATRRISATLFRSTLPFWLEPETTKEYGI